jgi:hypothetical protein
MVWSVRCKGSSYQPAWKRPAAMKLTEGDGIRPIGRHWSPLAVNGCAGMTPTRRALAGGLGSCVEKLPLQMCAKSDLPGT